jgi:hypothetical protein
MERRKFSGFTSSMGEVIATDASAGTLGGSMKAIEVTSERSESWQQDMTQAIIPDMS